MKSHKFIDYTYLEIKSLIDAGCSAIVPTGCTEQQGPHLAVDFDTWFAETVALEAAEYMARCYNVRALVLPSYAIWTHRPNIGASAQAMSTSRTRFTNSVSISSLNHLQSKASIPSLSGAAVASIG